MGALLEMEYVPLKFQLRRIEGDVAHKISSGPQGGKIIKSFVIDGLSNHGYKNPEWVAQMLYS